MPNFAEGWSFERGTADGNAARLRGPVTANEFRAQGNIACYELDTSYVFGGPPGRFLTGGLETLRSRLSCLLVEVWGTW